MKDYIKEFKKSGWQVMERGEDDILMVDYNSAAKFLLSALEDQAKEIINIAENIFPDAMATISGGGNGRRVMIMAHEKFKSQLTNKYIKNNETN